MNRITADMTSLHDFGMTPEMILDGERAEFEPEKKPSTRQHDYVRHDFAVKLVDAYADDLLAAYRAIEELEQENEQLKTDLSTATEAANTSAGQVKQMLAGNEEFGQAEKLLAQFESQMEQLAKDKQTDKAMIADLSKQVQDLIALKETVPQLEADVNAVLANLRSYFAEEGIEMPDGDYDDDYPG